MILIAISPSLLTRCGLRDVAVPSSCRILCSTFCGLALLRASIELAAFLAVLFRSLGALAFEIPELGFEGAQLTLHAIALLREFIQAQFSCGCRCGCQILAL